MISTTPRASKVAFSATGATAFCFCGAMLVSASSSAVTPLYRVYQQTFSLTPFLVTVIFASYVVSLLAALLTVGSLSDFIGRRPMIAASLLVNAVAMLLFAEAGSFWALVLARAVQGVSVAIGTTACGAAILDTSTGRGPLLNSVTAFLGLMAGALGSAALITWAPHPLQFIYLVLFGLTVVMLLLLLALPESCTPKPGAWAALRPRVAIPLQSRPILHRLTPANLAGWALGGFYLSLMPTVVSTAMGVQSPLVGGIVVSALMLSGTLTNLALRNTPPRRLIVLATSLLPLGVAVTTFGIYERQVVALTVGTIVAGVGFGAIFSGLLRALLPTAKPHERAGLLSAYYVQSYVAFAVPVVIAGLAVPAFGLANVAYAYGAATILLTLVSAVASARTND